MGAPIAIGVLAEELNNPFGFEGKKHRINQTISGDWHLTVTSLDLPDWLVHTPPGVELDLRMTAIDYDNPEVNLEDELGKRYLTRSVMLCKDAFFQNWINVEGEQAARDYLCERLGIESRAELRKNEQAQQKLDEILREFRDHRFSR